MKIVREHIFEKFTDDEYTDPIHDMGIGIFSPRHFTNRQECYEFVYDILPALFKVKNITDLLSKSELLVFKGNILKDLRKYIDKYITIEIDDKYSSMYTPGSWWDFDFRGFTLYLKTRVKKENKWK